MKKLYILIATILITVSSFSQAPEGFNYQAVARNITGDLIVSTPIAVQFKVHEVTLTGTVIYTETHSVTTNANGLFTTIVGQGTTSDVFNTIGWSTNAHFLEVSIDPANGTSYTSLGTSQLMSVPYALNANTLTGGVDKAYIDALEARLVALGPAVGDFIEGGIVFWVDPVNKTHGLVCAVSDQSSGIQWLNGSYVTTGATGTAIGTGSANTTAIIGVQGATATNYAAGLARAYAGGGFTDWFLPSKDELNAMYVNKAAINATAIANSGAVFVSNYYWSSTEYDNIFAWEQDFRFGSQPGSYTYYTNSVRAVRAF